MTLAFLATALVPLGIVGYFAHENIAQRTRSEHTRHLSGLASEVEARLVREQHRDANALRLLCQEDLVVEQLTFDGAQQRLVPAEEGDLTGVVTRAMASLSLDVLLVLDARSTGSTEGRVLAAAGFASSSPPTSGRTLLASLTRGYGATVLHKIRVRNQGAVREEHALLQACFAERDDVRVLVVGGRTLDERFVSVLAGAASPTQLELTYGAEESPPRHDTQEATARVVHIFHNSAGEPAARLWAFVDDASLNAQLDQLDHGFWLGGAAAVVLSLLLAWFLSLRVLRPLRDLQHAAARVAAGDLESSVATHRTGGEVERTLTAFNRMTHELRTTRERLLRAERIAAWRDIARRIAHEVKNPLSPIQVSIETMRKTYANKHPDFDEIFEESTLAILEEVERLKRIVTEFSQFARLPRPRTEPMSVRDVVEHVLSLRTGVIGAIANDLPEIRADREQIAQVLINLLQNAEDAARARHGETGGTVRIEVKRDPDRDGVLIRVEDNGPGVPAELKARIFDPYFTTKAGGTGLGLAIVYRIVGDHGGHVEVADAPSGGAIFEVFLPYAGPPPEADATHTDTVMPLMRKR